jgi:hypothetical protein
LIINHLKIALLPFLKTTLLFLFIWQISSFGFAQTDNLAENQCVPIVDTLDGQAVLKIVEKMPEFKGGMEGFYKFLSQNITIPQDSLHTTLGYHSKFFFTFVIDTLGRMRNFCVIKHNYYLLPELAINQLNQSNPWQAGENKGKKVPVRLWLPIYICVR